MSAGAPAGINATAEDPEFEAAEQEALEMDRQDEADQHANDRTQDREERRGDGLGV